MAASMGSLKIHEDPVLEQKEQLIRDLQDENLSLRQELESLRIGFPDGTNIRGDCIDCRTEDSVAGEKESL